MELEIRNLSKRYANGVQALDDVSLVIPPGMFGLLGRNGAGKSTLMRILATLPSPRPQPIRELLGHLRRETPPELAYLLDDLFENITLFKNRAKSATYQKQPDGRYALKLELFAQKVRADELGVEHEVPLGDLIEVGAVDADGVAVALEKHWIRAADTELTLLLDTPPVRAGIDPLDKLVDRNPDDNVIPAVEAAGPP